MLPFVGPSYTLPSAQTAAQRTVNMYLVKVETPEKNAFVLTNAPGMSLFGDISQAAAPPEPDFALTLGGEAILLGGDYLTLGA